MLLGSLKLKVLRITLKLLFQPLLSRHILEMQCIERLVLKNKKYSL